MMSMRRRIAGLEPEQIRALPQEEVDLPITADDFRQAVRNTSSSVAAKDLDRYQAWMDEFGST